ncbi:hypothetical protein ACH5RR_004282 [Cinchona calisaya]|uniref:Uncharacterized protein n=1 Tax=Cinchona calisaya TaxID=153742 RepID=A0ABD3AXK3_9GENT
MYRTASVTRVSDEYLVNVSPAAKGSPVPKMLVDAADDFQTSYDPILDATKKEISPKSSGEKVVHLIPLVLTLCALILWFFSKPVTIPGESQ